MKEGSPLSRSRKRLFQVAGVVKNTCIYDSVGNGAAADGLGLRNCAAKQ